ncbi:DUF5615 family PIN-like protein [Sphingomonas sp. SUN039]|uniref:DUF5615 family PIN-like protein n=1 Tax=Sphingomonas sp. SUN039 TaxID=2937787 RepID=UPI002164623C|nr:DUF5615 family PIN-like protein [Sphingomonas sp. SUN039]UVO55270.1 DUF5615 family PIN-like protein [Sphingomonas sp. SUN039]
MNFIVDEQLPPALARWIGEQADCTASHVFDHGLRSKPDDFICEMVRATEAVLVTKDDDFVVLYGASVERVVWVRCGNLANAKLLALFELNWTRVVSELEARNLVELR